MFRMRYCPKDSCGGGVKLDVLEVEALGDVPALGVTSA
jgi:hypothetical protein